MLDKDENNKQTSLLMASVGQERSGFLYCKNFEGRACVTKKYHLFMVVLAK